VRQSLHFVGACEATEDLADELTRRGHPACARHVAALLIGVGYRLEGRRKPRTDGADRARNAQLQRLNSELLRFLKRKQPAIFLDLKSRRNSLESRHGSRNRLGRWDQTKARLCVCGEAVVPKDLRPDLTNAREWKTMVLGRDTAKFATESICNWWKRIGRHRFRRAKELLCRGRRRQQRAPLASLGKAVGVAGRPIRRQGLRPAFSSGDDQMESVGLSPVQHHHAEPPRPPRSPAPGDCKSDRQPISERGPRLRRGVGDGSHYC